DIRSLLYFPPRRSSDLTASVFQLALVEVAIMLDAGNAQSLHARTVHRALPRCEFLQREAVAFEDLVDRQKAAIDGSHDLGLAAHDPTLRVGRRQVVDRQRLTQRADDLCRPDFLVFDHSRPRSPEFVTFELLVSLAAASFPLPKASELISGLLPPREAIRRADSASKLPSPVALVAPSSQRRSRAAARRDTSSPQATSRRLPPAANSPELVPSKPSCEDFPSNMLRP